LKLGLISTKNIREFLEKHLPYKNIEDLHFPFFATASSFIDGSQKIFDKGNLIEILIASSSIPVMFPPVFIEGVPYVDGGLSNNLPIEPLSDRKAETICIHVNPLKPFSPEEGVLEVLDRTLHLSFRKRVNESAENCHLLIEPNPLCKFGVFDLHKVEEIFEIGYSFTRALLEQGE
jgi:NTE family protein